MMKKICRDGYVYLRRGTLWWEAVRESDWSVGYMNARPVRKEKAVLLEAEWRRKN